MIGFVINAFTSQIEFLSQVKPLQEQFLVLCDTTLPNLIEQHLL